ncbi:ISL3 family transposase [Patescibacteria group bacterium]|nr:ISL3 family transposase [Patescibacteria group bacterium]
MATSIHIPFGLSGFKIDQVDDHSDILVIQAHRIASAARCPCCGQSSTRVHCHYTRSPRDLPCNGRRVRLVLGVRRFRCSNNGCKRQTFAERVPHLVPVHSQRTTRPTTVLRAIVFEVNADAGSRITQHLNMPSSADTLLRIIRQTPMASAPTPRVLGVDDWAFKKGNRYGTLLVDLETHRPIDLLPDRTTETLVAWFKAHPGIEVVSRDRSNEYIAAITAGAPHATQVADRWHLLHNVSEAVQRLLEKHAKALRLAAQQVQGQEDQRASDQEIKRPSAAPTLPSRREMRFGEVKHLVAEGYSQRTIARRLRMSRNTIRRYMDTDKLPRYPLRGPRPSAITAYVPHLEARWAEGYHNSRILWEELHQQGYPGSYSSVRRFVQRYRSGRWRTSSPLPPVVRPLSPRQATWLLVLAPDELSVEQATYREALCRICPEIATAYELVQRFGTLIRQRQAHRLDSWLTEAHSSSLSQLKTFASGLLKDYDAIRAALELEWSNGQVEGQVNRLKVIKRDMYGRAKFDLLRLRVLHPP